MLCKPLLFHFTAHIGAPGRKPVQQPPPVKVCPCAPWPWAWAPHLPPSSSFPEEALSTGGQQEERRHGELPHGSEAVSQRNSGTALARCQSAELSTRYCVVQKAVKRDHGLCFQRPSHGRKTHRAKAVQRSAVRTSWKLSSAPLKKVL